MITVSLWFWLGFLAFILFMLALDLGIFNKHAKAVSFKEACIWSGVWIALALIFNAGVWWHFGKETALEFLTGYIVEYSLSMDNIFVMVMLFAAFKTSAQYQHRVLFWGILGALFMRGILILLGAALVHKYVWVLYIFGAFLIVTGIKMAFSSEKPKDLDKNFILNMMRKLFRVTRDYEGDHFFVVKQNKIWITPLFLVLLMVEFTDLIFAVDSIPAILAITQDPFIVFTSNAFAILGLRSMYFMLPGMTDKFHYLKLGLSGALVFIGTKMALAHFYEIPTFISLLVIVTLLAIAILASLIREKRLHLR